MNSATKCRRCRGDGVIPSGEVSRHGDEFNQQCDLCAGSGQFAEEWPGEETSAEPPLPMAELVKLGRAA